MKKILLFTIIAFAVLGCGNDEPNNDNYENDPEFPSIAFDEPPLEKYGRIWQSKDSVVINNVNYKMYFNINHTFSVSSKNADKYGTLIRTHERYVSDSETRHYECLYKYNHTHLKVNTVREMIISGKDTSYVGVIEHSLFPFVRDTIESKIYTRQKPMYELFTDSLIINNIVLIN